MFQKVLPSIFNPFPRLLDLPSGVCKMNFLIKMSWKTSIHSTPDWPRQEAVAKFRLQTGHDILAKHLSRFGILRTPTCKLCNLEEDMDRDHLMRCPVLRSTSESGKYWEVRNMINQMDN